MSQGILSKIFRGPRSTSSVTHNLVVKYNDLLILFLDFLTIISAVRESSCSINAFKYWGICTGLMTYFSNDIQTFSEFKFRFPVTTLSVSVMLLDEKVSRHLSCNYNPFVWISSSEPFGVKLSRDFKLKRSRNASIAIERAEARFSIKLALFANILNLLIHILNAFSVTHRLLDRR